MALAKESEKARILILEHGEFWEYLLAEELLQSKLPMLKSECHEFEKKLLSIPKRRFGGPEFISWLVGKTHELTLVVEKMERCVNEELPASLGRPGTSCDAMQILGAVDALFGCCRAFLAFELDIWAADPPVQLKVFETAFRGITLSVVGVVERLADEWGRAVEDLRSGSREFRVELKFPNLPQLHKALTEMHNVGKHPELYV